MAGDMLGIGTSGLLAYQQSLATISHNITNVNTEGYSRQRTELVTRPPQGFGNGFVGTGVAVDTVSRIYDQFLIDQVNVQTSRANELNSFYDLSSRIDNLLSDPQAGLTPTMEEFFDAVQGVADAPGSIPARQVMLTNAESLVERAQTMYDGINALNRNISLDVTNIVSEINALANNIAEINDQIVLQSRSFGQPPNDLLDQRDEMVRQLAERVAVSTVAQDDGALNVFIGSGQGLVVGSIASSLRVTQSPYDASQFDIEISTGATTGINITNSLTGGKLGGIIDFKNQILDPSLNQLGRVIIGLTSTFNAQHQQGMTLNDTMGGLFFNDQLTLSPNSDAVLDHTNNSVQGAVSLIITDPSALTANDYILRADGGDNYTLLRQPNNQVATTFNVAPGGTSPTFEGIAFTIGATPPAFGDTTLLRPTRTAARDVALVLNDVSEIAAAGAVRASAATSNRGDATISEGELLTPPPGATVTIEFRNSAGTTALADEYTVDGGATWLAYSSGSDIDVNNMRVQITGTPFAGDTFTMEANTGGVSDNRNALALAGLQTAKTLINGSVDTQGAYGQLVSLIGTKTHQAEISSDAQQTVLDQAVAARQAISGVNLDEEAADLIRFQQAYQATSKVITTAQTMFQTLLDAVR